MKKFKIGKVELPYFIHSYNNTAKNERKVEVALGNYFMDRFDNVLEVGAVMPYYGRIDHDVVDTGRSNDKFKKIIREDAVGYSYVGRNVLSISTVEHMRDKSFECLKNMIIEAKNMLVTFPVGFNKEFDKQVEECDYDYLVMKKRDGKWVEVKDTKMLKYDYVRGNGANAICIFTTVGAFYDNLHWNR